MFLLTPMRKNKHAEATKRWLMGRTGFEELLRWPSQVKFCRILACVGTCLLNSAQTKQGNICSALSKLCGSTALKSILSQINQKWTTPAISLMIPVLISQIGTLEISHLPRFLGFSHHDGRMGELGQGCSSPLDRGRNKSSERVRDLHKCPSTVGWRSSWLTGSCRWTRQPLGFLTCPSKPTPCLSSPHRI